MPISVQDLLQQQPEAMKEYKQSVLGAAQAGEKERIDAAVKAAIDEQNKKGAPAASLAQLRAAVPEKMEGRDTLILELMEAGATESQAHQKVAARLAAENAELRKQSGAKPGKGGSAIEKEAEGVTPIRIATRASIADAETYEDAVEIETENVLAREPKLSDMQARAKARATVSRDRRDLLNEYNTRQEKVARERAEKKKAG